LLCTLPLNKLQIKLEIDGLRSHLHAFGSRATRHLRSRLQTDSVTNLSAVLQDPTTPYYNTYLALGSATFNFPVSNTLLQNRWDPRNAYF